jgi:hypothetical protein
MSTSSVHYDGLYRSINGTAITISADIVESIEEDKVSPIYGSGVNQTLRMFLACWPAAIRFAQCIRRYSDSKKTFPHLTNAGKYSTTFFKVKILRKLFDSMSFLILHIGDCTY